MPRPKGAGRDPRLGRVSSRVLDHIFDDYDSGQRERLVRRIRRLQERALDLAEAEGGLETYGPDGPMGPPPAMVAAQVATQVAMGEEIISRIREREVKVDGMAHALFEALNQDQDDGEGVPLDEVLGPARRAAETNSADDDGPGSKG